MSRSPTGGGNRGRPGDDSPTMTCARCREEISADLDAEGDPGIASRVEAHVASCADCRAWRSRAARVTRLTRTASADPGPDVAAGVVVHSAPTRRRDLSGVRRGALAAVGAVQLALGAVGLGPGAHMADPGAGPMAGAMLGAGMVHMSHEAAAWNLALGVALIVGAVRSRLLPGLLPGLGVFLAVLTVLSGLDLAAGRVEPARVVSHLVLVVGFVLAVLVTRRDVPPPPRVGGDRRGRGARTSRVWPARGPAGRQESDPTRAPRPGGLDPAVRRRDAA